MDEFIYMLKDGVYHWRGEPVSDRLAIAYEETGWILMKHGSADRVKEWYDYFMKVIKEMPVDEELFNVKYLELKEFDLDKLNKALQCARYVEKFVEGYGKEA